MKIRFLKKSKRKKAFGLIEIMISILLVGFILSGTVALIITAYVSIQASNQKVRANSFNQEQLNALTQYKQNNWHIVADNTGTNQSNPIYLTFLTTTTISGTTTITSPSTTITGSGTNFQTDLVVGDSISVSASPDTYVTVTSIDPSLQSITVSGALANGSNMTIRRFGKYSLQSGQNTFVDAGTTFNVSFTLDTAYRNTTSACSSYGLLDNTANSSCSYVSDSHYRWATFTTSWKDISNNVRNTAYQTYINDYDSKNLSIDTYDDMRIGSQLSNTSITNNSGDGSIQLSQVALNVYANSGQYTSAVFDTSNVVGNYFTASLRYTMTTGVHTIVSDFRSSSSLNTLSSTSWSTIDSSCFVMPPDITPDYIRQCELYTNFPSFKQKRYFQFRVTLTTTNTSSTPVLKYFNIYYQ